MLSGDFMTQGDLLRAVTGVRSHSSVSSDRGLLS